MNDKEILANAPEGATHYSNESECYYRTINNHWNEVSEKYSIWIKSPDFSIRSLADIQRIVELEEEIKRLQASELEQQAKGIDVFKCEINQLLQCSKTKRNQLLHAADLNIEMLCNQAKEQKS